MPVLWSIFITRPKGVARRWLGMREATVTPAPSLGIIIIGPDDSFDRLSLVDLPNPLFRHQMVVGANPVRVRAVRCFSRVLQATVVVLLAAPPTLPAPPARGRGQGQDYRGGHQGLRCVPRGGRSGGRFDGQRKGRHSHFYADPARAEAEASDSVITGTILLCQYPTLALFDPGSTFLFVSVYYVSRLSMISKPLVASLRVSTPVGESLVVDQVKAEHLRPSGEFQRLPIPEWKWDRITMDFVVLEDMLRACVLEFGCRWDQLLPLAEFAYNNSYHSSIEMSPFEALFGRRCRSLVCWFESTKPRTRGIPLCVTHEGRDEVWELALPPAFSAIHPVFHVSMLRRYVPDESHVLQYDAIDLDDRLTFVEELYAILASDVRRLRLTAILVVKVR
ncbi:hypothetical protein MTR67_044189 [Solanum verrucosum]|uniref:Uncharacterized protein n=1 Tax=Solanum verrucosum TaxID=315347 RepID=A0AAF0UT15_SOLVR|nr:hypothetical protein MTR67_044189 [Solanum verrucosum]